MKILSYILVFLSFFGAIESFGQKDDLGPTFLLNGITEDNREDLPGVDVTVTNDGKVFLTKKTDKRGKFEIELPYGSVFKIEFAKADYATKHIEVDTRGVTEEDGKWGFEWPKMKVEMYPIFEGVDYGMLKNPVGRIGYNELIGNFDPDKKYQRSVDEGITRLEKAVDAARRESEIREETLEEDYQLAIKDGQLFFEEEDYQNALLQFEAAAELKPQAILPKDKIEEINKILDANRSEEERYVSLLTRADNSFAEEKWEESKDFYNRALAVFSDKNYPKEQIIIIDQKLEELAELARQQALAAAEEKEKQRIFDDLMEDGDKAIVKTEYNTAIAKFEEAQAIFPDNNRPALKIAEVRNKIASIQQQYDSFVSQADASFSQGNYEMAMNQYKKALTIKADEAYPKTQIDKAKEKMNLLADANKQYEQYVKDAEKAFTADRLEDALALYKKANELKPNEPIPAEKITNIEGLIAKRAADEAERIRLEKERLAQLKTEYDQLIVQADAKMETNDFAAAKPLYEQAAEKMPSENYPKLQLEKIRAELQQLAKLADQYEDVLAKADRSFDLKNWKDAKAAYERALELKPEETHPLARLKTVNEKLAELAALEEQRRQEEIARQKELEANYTAAIQKGDQAFAAENWQEALTAYQNASNLKNQETYPKERIGVVQAKIAAIAQAEEEARIAAELAKKNKALYDQLISQGNSFVNIENYAAARKKYQEAVELIPSGEEAKQKLQEVNGIIAQKEAEKEAAEKAAAEQRLKDQEFADALQLGNTALSAQKFDEAIAEYKKAQAIKPDSPVPAEKIKEAQDAKAALAAEKEAARLAAEERKKKLEEYTKLVEEADALFGKKEYEEAKTKYTAAAALFPDEVRPKSQLKKINDILDERRRIAEENAKTDTEFNYELAKKYPQGKTENEFKEGNKTVTQIVFVNGKRGDEYKKEVYSWGQKFYLKNGKPYTEANWLKEVNALK